MIDFGSIHLDKSGPLFQRDPKATLETNTRRMIQGLTTEGERMVRAGWTNSVRGRGGVVGRTKSLSGQQWVLHGTVTPEFIYPWPGAGNREYRGGRNKMRRRAFGAVLGRIRAAKPELLTDITQGLR